MAVKTYDNLSYVWKQYFQDTQLVNDGDAWSIVFMAPTEGDLLLSLANPYTEQQEEIYVRNVSQKDYALFASHYKRRFLINFGSRFGFSRPEVNQVLTEYPDWNTFYTAWLNNDARLAQGNMSLLFDYPSQEQYRAMQLKDADFAGYRRLLVVIYQYRKQQFQKIFIKDVDDAMYLRIQHQIIDLYSATLPEIITKRH